MNVICLSHKNNSKIFKPFGGFGVRANETERLFLYKNIMEKWEKINGFKYYEISDLGRVKSFKTTRIKILKPNQNTGGYLGVNLFKNGIGKTRLIHQLVAEAFLNHIPNGFKLVINHKNFIKTDNRVENLEIVTMRENLNKKHIKSSSIYTGVHWAKYYKKWISAICVNGNMIYLGRFDNELEASKYYENAIISVKNGENIKVKRYKNK